VSEQPETRRDEILNAALAIAFEAGPGRVTTVAIAKRLDITQPAIYRHFQSKADLWRAITDRLGAEVDQNIAAANAGAGPAIDRLKALILGHLRLVQRTPALPEIMLARDPNSADSITRMAMQAHMAAFQQLVARLCADAQAERSLRRDVNPNDIAALVMGVMQSLVLRLLISRNTSVLASESARLLNLQLAAFAEESSQTCETD